MKWSKLRQWLLPILLAVLILLFWTTAAATGTQVSRHTDVIRFGGDVTITKEMLVDDAIAVAGSVKIDDGATLQGNAVAVAGDVILNPQAQIRGDATAIAGEVKKASDAVIHGTSTSLIDGKFGIMQSIRAWGTWGLLLHLYLVSAIFHGLVICAIAIIGILLLILIPHYLQSVAVTIEQHPLIAAAWGLGGTVGLMLLSTLIAGSLLGALVLPVANLAALLAILVGSVSMGLVIGQTSFKHRQFGFQLVAGIFMLGLIGLIPVVGGMVYLIVHVFGFGGILATQFEHKRLIWFGQRRIHPELLPPSPTNHQQPH